MTWRYRTVDCIRRWFYVANPGPVERVTARAIDCTRVPIRTAGVAPAAIPAFVPTILPAPLFPTGAFAAFAGAALLAGGIGAGVVLADQRRSAPEIAAFVTLARGGDAGGQPVPVPEPSSVVLLGACVGAMALIHKRNGGRTGRTPQPTAQHQTMEITHA